MRPDLDDFDDINDVTESPRSRAMSWVVLAVAVVGFGVLAHYAYRSGTSASGEGDMMLVAADPSPIKQEPVDPEGEQFPNQDKTIYDVIAPPSGEQKVEKLLPEPEKAVTAESAPAPAKTEPTTTTYVNKKIDAAAEPAAEKTVTPTEVKEVPVVGVKEEKPKVVLAKPAEKPAPKPAVTAAKGDYKIQLGAFKSEAEAQAIWKKISGKYSDVLQGPPIIVKADLPNGTFYRLRASGYASADAAKAACAKLTAQKQACMPVGK